MSPREGALGRVLPRAHARGLTASMRAVQPNDLLARRSAWLFVAVAFVALGLSIVMSLTTATTFLTAVAFVAAIIGLYRPILGLYGVGILCTIDPLTRVLLATGGIFRWNTLNYFLIVVAALYSPYLFSMLSAPVRLLQALACVIATGLLISQDLTRGTYDLMTMCSAFGLVIFFLKASASEDAWGGLALVTGTLAALLGFAFVRSPLTAAVIDPNALVAVPVCGLFGICLGFPKVTDHRRQAVLAVLAVTNASWAFLSGSRGGLLTSLSALLFLLLMVRGLHRRVVAVGAAALVALAISSEFTELQSNALHRINKLLDTEETMEHRTSRRSDLVLGGLYLFAQRPVLGVGTGGFVPAWQAMSSRPEMREYEAASGKIAHSAWIKVLVENGAVGGLLFGAFVASFTVTGWRSRRRDLRFLGLFTTVTLSILFLTQEFQAKAQWFLAAGMIAMLHHRRPGFETGFRRGTRLK